MLKFLNRLKSAKRRADSPVPDASVPGFRHRVHEPEYARLGLPFCRQDSIRKLAVLLDEEAALRAAE
tara:strand:- start:102869 stop:103069 length:201 start_codon:yes stop_codon:yes gene_type:complete